MKAHELMKKGTSVSDRIVDFTNSIQRNIKRDIIDSLYVQKEKLQDKIFSLQDFTLETNINSGQAAISREECEKRFKDIIENEYQLVLLDEEIKVKEGFYNKYFGEETLNDK